MFFLDLLAKLLLQNNYWFPIEWKSFTCWLVDVTRATLVTKLWATVRHNRSINWLDEPTNIFCTDQWHQCEESSLTTSTACSASFYSLTFAQLDKNMLWMTKFTCPSIIGSREIGLIEENSRNSFKIPFITFEVNIYHELYSLHQ